MAKMNGKDGHWYTDQNGNHYFVGEGESPKEGWEKTKRRKMIDGGKYKVDDGDGKGSREVSMEEYDKYEAEDGDFDLTTDDDFGFDTDDRPTPEQDLENEEIWDADYERSYGPYDFDAWDDVEMLKKAYGKAKEAGMEDSAQNALERIEELGGEFDADETDNQESIEYEGYRLERTKDGKWINRDTYEYYDTKAEAQKDIDDYIAKSKPNGKSANESFDPDESDGTNGWKPSDEATPAYDAGGFYSINEGDKWELDDGGSVEVRNVDGENVEVVTPNGTKRMTKDRLSDMVKNATKITADANKGNQGSDDSWSAENPKYKGFNTSDATNVKVLEEGDEYEDPNTGKKSKLKIIEYTPYGLLRFGRKDRMYGIVGDDYEGGDTHRKGAIVAPSLKSAKEQLKEFTDYYKAQKKEKKR